MTLVDTTLTRFNPLSELCRLNALSGSTDTRQPIFERFYRLDKARSRRLGGAGLGLPLAKGTVEAYGGRVEVQSAVGRGSTFTVRLPIVRPLPPFVCQ